MAGASARRIVVFDLGGVLIDHNPRHLYRKLFDDAGAMEHFLATVCTPAWNRRQDAGRPIAEAVAELQAQHPDEAGLIAAYYGRWSEMLGGSIDGTVAILADLRARGTPCYALTNWSAETFPIARARFGFLDWFQGIVISGEVGLIKPDRRIFELLCATHGFPAKDAAFFDDSPKNVEAACRLGFHGIRFSDAHTLSAELAALDLL